MISKNTSRREFIKTLAAGTAGIAFSMPASSYARIVGANERVRVGIVGFSKRARKALIPSMMKVAPQMNFDIVAVSDIWSLRREEGVESLSQLTGHKVAGMRNNEELYEKGDVDAVIISTADFQHALHCDEAVKAGCDVYVEKPLANTMEDARQALQTVESSDRIVQVGTQRRSGKNYIAANEFIRSGKFGDIVIVELNFNVNQPGRWRRPELVAKLRPEDTDWKRYLMNRPYEEFDARKYVEFRLFWPYSSGIPDQWLVHQIDTVHWFADLPRPRSVVANGGIYKWRDGRGNFDTVTAVFDYGPLNDMSKGFQVIFSSRQTNSAHGLKEEYFSNGGKLSLDTNMVTPEGGLKAKRAKVMGMEAFLLPEMKLIETTNGDAAENADKLAYEAHVKNWMECMRSRKGPNADIHAAYNHSVALCMTIAALHTGKRCTFDDVKQEVVMS